MHIQISHILLLSLLAIPAIFAVTAYASEVAYNKFVQFGDPNNPISTTIASATTVTPLSYISIITGTAQIQNINLPWPGFEGDLIFIFTNGAPGATLTGGATGTALAKATTVVQYQAVHFTYSQVTGLWYPSY